jgi:hypothetical protein
VAKCARQTTDDSKSKIFPKAQCSFVGRDDEVELHCTKAEAFSLQQTMLCHGTANSVTLSRRRNHETGIGHVRSKSWLVGVENVSADDFFVGYCNVTTPFLIGPICQRFWPRDVRIKDISIASRDNRPKNLPNRVAIIFSGAANLKQVPTRISGLGSDHFSWGYRQFGAIAPVLRE